MGHKHGNQRKQNKVRLFVTHFKMGNYTNKIEINYIYDIDWKFIIVIVNHCQIWSFMYVDGNIECLSLKWGLKLFFIATGILEKLDSSPILS